MDLKLIFDKESSKPLYTQICEQITEAVNKGKLKPGEKLPPERELASQIGISRGTIKKAFLELERSGVIFSVQGSGSFIEDREEYALGRKDKAIKAIDSLIDELEKLGFEEQEIRIFFDLRLRQKNEMDSKFKLAIIDCNIEAINSFSKQLSYLPNIEINSFLLDDIKRYRKPTEMFESFDILLTTTTHIEVIKTLVPTVAEKVIKCAVSPSSRTLVSFAQIDKNSKIAILCDSLKFAGIVKGFITKFEFVNEVEIFTKENEGICTENINKYNIIVTPPNFLVNSDKEIMESINDFRLQGGVIINFEYQIERGSMLYIEERISKTKINNNK